MTIVRSALALQDYRDIWKYIAADNPDAADSLLAKIDLKLELYARYPKMGQNRDDLSPDIRSFPVGKYLVFYRARKDGIEVARVIHGARQLGSLFE
jgi:toxin ParE1/3/4